MRTDDDAPRARDLDSIVQDAFASSLSLRDFSEDDNFFDLGGTSLTAALLLTQLEDRLKIEIPVSMLLENPTSRGVARRLRALLAGVALA